jgi:DNA-binding GntR family transcriptional regulator
MATIDDGVPDLARVGDERTMEQVVAARLRRSILDGALAPGARLRYRQLADQFGVSVTPVRVALKELAGEGLVELRPHAGVSVSALSVEELEEVLLTRASLEPFLALHGAGRLTDDDLAEMAGRLDEVRAVTRALDRDGYLDASWELRSIVYRAAERPRLLARIVTLYDLSRRYHHVNLADTDRLARSLAYMEEFHGACVARDGVQAQAAMREGLEWTLAYLVEAL